MTGKTAGEPLPRGDSRARSSDRRLRSDPPRGARDGGPIAGAMDLGDECLGVTVTTRRKTPIRVVVIVESFYTRLGIVSFLRGQSDVEVVGEAADGQSGLALVERVRPQVAVVALRMPELDGARLTAILRERMPELPILLTDHDGDDEVFAAIETGAQGHLTKEASAGQLLAAVHALVAGQRFVPPEIAAALARRAPKPDLTRRERQVLELLAEGLSNREAADHLGISIRTVAIYVSSILDKLDATSRTDAVVSAMRRGLVSQRIW